MYWLDVVSYRSDVPPVAYVSRLSTMPPEQLTTPAAVAVQVTVVVPGANVRPEAGVQLGTPGPSTTSLDSAEYVTLAPAAEVAYAELSAGSCNVGAVVSTTLTV